MEYASLVGKQLGAYQIQAKLGEGGMACVYKGYHNGLGREAAIKVIRPYYADQANFQALFEREAQLIAKLQHRNIITVYDFGRIENHTYLAMQYVNGGTLRDRLRGKQPLEPRSAAIYALQIARALHHAHCRSIVHRDVKPENMLLASADNNELLLSDFGIAQLFETDQEMIAAAAATNPGNKNVSVGMVGTPAYMAPEQFQKQAIDPRTDVYALGVVLYEMLTGQKSFQADNLVGMCYQHVCELPKPIREINPALPKTLEQITMRALEKRPEQRYQSADEMAQALKALLVPPSPPQVKIISTPQLRPKNRVKLVATLLIIVLTIIQILTRLGVLHWLGKVFH